MKRMLINATQAEELRVAIADGQKLIDLDLETPAHEQKKANVYKARITRVEHSLEACFVNYGSERHGFLPFKEINPSALPLPQGTNPNNVNLKEVLREGQELIVQVEKEERGTKGAALSTYISLAGRYSVLMPNSPKSGGVSRRISGEERDQIRAIMDQLDLPKDTGLIIRTAGVGRDIEELQWDLDYLKQLWAAIEKAADEHKAPFLIYQESNLIIRALRDYLRDDINEILIDDEGVYQSALEFMQLVMPYNLRKLKQYQSEAPLFTRYQIESQIETAFAREVTLPSGGSLVIDHTEAMLSIDINSARATKGSDIEETALQTNLEASDEIARQLRIRDLGGLVVIDFIDMLNRGNQRKVEERLRDALSHDRARIQTGRISKFGLLEMSRQRMRPSIGESSYQVCPRCIGHGSIRSVESLALSMIRLIEEEAIKDHTGQILAQAPTKVANFLHNEKREAISTIEKRHDVPILVLANPDMHTPRFEIKRLRKDDVSTDPSYLQVNLEEGEVVASETTKSIAAAEKPAVSGVRPTGPAPQKKPETKKGWWSSIVAFFSGSDADEDKPRRSKRKPKPTRKKAEKPNRQQRNQAKQDRGSKKTTKRPNQRKKTGKKTAHKKVHKKTAKKQAKKQAQNQNQNQNQGQGQNQNNQPNQNNANAADGNKQTPRRRGKRGGRKRRSRQQPNQNQNQNQNQNNAGNDNAQQADGNQNNQNAGNQNTDNQKPNTGNQNNQQQNPGQQASNQPNNQTGNQANNQGNRNQAPRKDQASDNQAKSAVQDNRSASSQNQSAQNASSQKPVDRTQSDQSQAGRSQNQSPQKTADQNQPKSSATNSDTKNQAQQHSSNTGNQPSGQTPNQAKPAQDNQRSNQSSGQGQSQSQNKKPADQQASTRDSKPANAQPDSRPAAERPASSSSSSQAGRSQQPSSGSKPASNGNKPAQQSSQPSQTSSAAPAQKPADQVKVSGPSAKPEGVKGLYSLGDTPSSKPAKPSGSDQPAPKDDGSPKRSGTDG